MSEITSHPIATILGERGDPVKVEESWSKDVPATVGANAPIEELNRTKLIEAALKRPSARRNPPPMEEAAITGNPGIIPYPPGKPVLHHFFLIKGKRLELLGSKECPVEKFAKDISGRFFREWLKQAFPRRKDYEDICVWNDRTPLKEITDLLDSIA